MFQLVRYIFAFLDQSTQFRENFQIGSQYEFSGALRAAIWRHHCHS